MTKTAKIVREHLEASKRVRAEAVRTPQSARDLLVRAGILTKGGKQLAKPYR